MYQTIWLKLSKTVPDCIVNTQKIQSWNRLFCLPFLLRIDDIYLFLNSLKTSVLFGKIISEQVLCVINFLNMFPMKEPVCLLMLLSKNKEKCNYRYECSYYSLTAIVKMLTNNVFYLPLFLMTIARFNFSVLL